MKLVIPEILRQERTPPWWQTHPRSPLHWLLTSPEIGPRRRKDGETGRSSVRTGGRRPETGCRHQG